MAPFLLFAFVFASQVIGGFNKPDAYGNTITMLSIDGSGIKGIVPSVVLRHLEKALKKVSKDEKAALADYFDMIGGTGTGGLIAAMLTAPSLSDSSRPAFTAQQILQFHLDFGPSIFNQTAASGWNHNTPGPQFDGKFLHAKIREILRETRLKDTLTNLIIPIFDIKKLHPVVFSSLKLDDVKLSDISIATSSTPSLLPPYSFMDGVRNNINEGLSMAQTAEGAMQEQTNILQKISNSIHVNRKEPIKLVLLSLGCGRTDTKGVDARIAQSLSFNEWIPLTVTTLTATAEGINEYHLASVFPDLPSSDNYRLRVQEYNLDSTIGIANSTKENMDKLVKVGEDLLNQIVKVQDVTSFVPYQKPSEGTNGQALRRLAKLLYHEKQYRLKMKSMEKGERTFIK